MKQIWVDCSDIIITFSSNRLSYLRIC